MELNLYECHRKFLDSYLALHKLSLSSLANKTDKVVSTATLSRVVKKNRSGAYEKAFNISIESWVELVAKMKLTKEETLQATLLRVKDTISSVDTKIMKETKNLFKKVHTGISDGFLKDSSLSQEALSVAEAYDKLPKRFQKSVATETFKVIGYLDDLNPVQAETLKKNKRVMRRIIK